LRYLFNPARDSEAMHFTQAQGFEDHHVQRPLQKIGLFRTQGALL
jgi:hypothetical protein